MDIRIGFGFDVHKFAEGRKLVLCGVELDYPLGLLGHSDADVGLHAIIDAMLSAAGLPDIGSLFPDTDPNLKGISSDKLLYEAKEKVFKRGFKVAQVDLTFVCDEPKLSPYYGAMKKKLAELLELEEELISVKARRTEGVFGGKEKGITCFCSLILKKA